MPLVTDFLAPVYQITNRPDMVSETTAFLSRSLFRAHSVSDYRFDIQELLVPYAGNMELSAAVPDRMRRVHQVTGENFRVHEVTPAALWDENAFLPDKRNTYYVGGTTLNFRITDAFTNLKVQYFQRPTFADSFIAINYPECITHFAAAYIFATMKNAEKAKVWAGLANDVDAELIKNYFAI